MPFITILFFFFCFLLTSSNLLFIGFSAWHMTGNQAQDEVFLAAQEAVGAHRDSQGKIQNSIIKMLQNQIAGDNKLMIKFEVF